MKFTIYKLWWVLVLLLAVVSGQWSVVRAYPPAPATQAQVDAGLETYLYLTPYTFAHSSLAGGGTTNGMTKPQVQQLLTTNPIPAANLTGSATLPDSVLSANVDLLNGNQVITGIKTFSSFVSLSQVTASNNPASLWGGSFFGNGNGLTNLLHSSTVSAGSGISVTPTQNADGSTNYAVAATGAGSGAAALTNANNAFTSTCTNTFNGPVNINGSLNASNAVITGATVTYAITNISAAFQIGPTNDFIAVTNGVTYKVPTNSGLDGQTFTLICPYSAVGTWTLTNTIGNIGAINGAGKTNVWIGGQDGSGSNCITFVMWGTNALRPN